MNELNKKIFLLYCEMNPNPQDLLHQVIYLKVIYKQVQYIQMHDDYKHDDKIYEI